MMKHLVAIIVSVLLASCILVLGVLARGNSNQAGGGQQVRSNASQAPFQANGAFRAKAFMSGSYDGVNGTLEIADPVLRRPPPEFSASQVAIVFPQSQWIEAGWTKDAGIDCNPWLYWATNPGWANRVAPAIIGRKYRFAIALANQTYYLWRVRITDDNTNQVIFLKEDITTSVRFTKGIQIQANGEVGITDTPDMGISGLLNLKYRLKPGPDWPFWDATSTRADNPYRIAAITMYSFQVSGNQGRYGFYCQ